ncbi:hypothetical protein ACWDA7_39930 [Streptomyces sp. NPDC001156]
MSDAEHDGHGYQRGQGMALAEHGQGHAENGRWCGKQPGGSVTVGEAAADLEADDHAGRCGE